MNPPRGQMCSAFGSEHVLAVARGNRQLLVIVIQRLFAHRRDFARDQCIADRRTGAVGRDRRLRGAVIDPAGRLIAQLDDVLLVRQTEHGCPKLNVTFGSAAAASTSTRFSAARETE